MPVHDVVRHPKLRFPLALLPSVLVAVGCAHSTSRTPDPTASMKRLTPILFVDSIEPCLPFWTERLGFVATIEVPAENGEGLGFVSLESAPVEVMLQTVASLEADIPDAVDVVRGSRAFLFVEVEDVATLDRLEEILREAGDDFVLPRRTTFYGADEVVVRSPCGSIVTLAAFPDGAG